jgi:acetolactate synthase small subunit
MTEYTQDALAKVIKDHQEKVHSLTQALRLKHVQRERTEAEIVELKGEIEKAEDFVKLMQTLQNGIEDKVIATGLRTMKRRKNARRTDDEPQRS